MRIAIDGPAGSGKSTVARALAQRCGLTYLDTGAMYRAVTLACLRKGVATDDAQGATRVARECSITFGPMVDGRQKVYLDGQDVTDDIRTAQVDHEVSVVSGIPQVREVMVQQQRQLGSQGDVVAEGRDIGTVVFPDAEVKVFLTADPEARAHRRAVQRQGGDAAKGVSAQVDPRQEQQILDDLVRRDRLDSSHKVGPLRAAEDAVHIDSSKLTVRQELDQIEALMRKARETAAKPASETKPAAASKSATEPKATAEPKAAPARKPGISKSSRSAKAKGPIRAFTHASFDDYFDHPMSDFPMTSKAALAIAVYIVGFITKVLWRWRIEDADELWHEGGRKSGQTGRVIVMNHASMLDPVVMVITEWMHHHRVRCVYKSEFNKNSLVMWAFSRAGAIPVKRGTADVNVVRRAQRALKNGEDVLIFPEGTRIKSDDQPIKLHAGFAVMAQMGRAKVLPMAIVGARDITPPHSHAKRFHNVYLKVGKPLGFDELGVKGRKQQATAMEKAAMDRVYALRDQLRSEHPGKM
ncbi:MAG: (d)CMP kinase [Atopobiaceae bacterium]